MLLRKRLLKSLTYLNPTNMTSFLLSTAVFGLNVLPPLVFPGPTTRHALRYRSFAVTVFRAHQTNDY